MKMRDINLETLNSATKYPSIMTYHILGQKGRLTDQRYIEPSEDLIVTEKVDGTNTRVIFLPDGNYIIGSREHLLYACGDLIGNPAMGIVDSLKPFMESMNGQVKRSEDQIIVAFFETYGGKTTAAAKNYTSDQSLGHRIFDVAKIEAKDIDRSLAEISAWRENSGQSFLSEADLTDFARNISVDLTHRIKAPLLPTEHEDVMTWLSTVIPSTFAAIDAKAKGEAEGVVVRTPDRRSIAKIRFADYKRSLKLK